MNRSVPSLLSAAALLVSSLWPLQAHALFGDDEARKAIIELRNKFDTHRQSTDNTLSRMAQEVKDSQASTQRSLLELSNQNEQLRGEIARLRGQNEQLAREVSELQRQQKDAQAGVDARLRQVEPVPVSLDGREFTASPEEKRDFDATMELLRRSEFGPAAAGFAGFLRRYPSSGYTPSVLYWLGNAQYATRDYKEAITNFRSLLTAAPSHQRAPEAMLSIANCQVELKDTRAAKATLESLVKTYPQSEAAQAGRERLARLK